MNREFSPEERLLRLIKGKSKPSGDAENANEKPKDGPVLAESISPAAVVYDNHNVENKNKVQPSDRGQSTDKAKHKSALAMPKIALDTRYLIFGLILIAIFSGLYFLFNLIGTKDDQDIENIKQLIASMSDTSQPGIPEVRGKVPAEDKKPMAQERQKSFDDYNELIKAKSIFEPSVTGTRKAAATEGPSLNDLVKDLRLVGIIPGDIPQAIIEDRKNNQTLFLKEGEMVNSMEVKSISAGRVVLEYNEETITLSL